jgi:hypothetical protein
MTLVKKLHKRVRNNWWFINRVALFLIMNSIIVLVVLVDAFLQILENLLT